MSELGIPPVQTEEMPPLSPTLAALYGRSHPMWEVQKEEPWMTQAAWMFAAGNLSAKEVAEVVDKDERTCRNLLRQDWFQRKVTEIIATHGGKDVMTLFRAEAFNSLVTLVEIRDNPKESAAVRSANARDILDRAFGKATNRIEYSETPTSPDPVGEAKRLLEDNARLIRK